MSLQHRSWLANVVCVVALGSLVGSVRAEPSTDAAEGPRSKQRRARKPVAPTPAAVVAPVRPSEPPPPLFPVPDTALPPVTAPATATNDRVTQDLISTQKNGVKLYRRETNAVRRTGAIEIDGVLDDEGWQVVTPTRFDWQERPHEGGKAIGVTEFRVSYDDNAVYVAVHANDPEPTRIKGVLHHPLGLTKVPQSDWLVIYIDPTLNRRMAYGFGINPAGVMMEFRQFSGGVVDDSYQAVWEGRAARTATGWSAEYRIPYSQMRVRDGYQDRWGFQIQRKVSRTQERDFWSPFTYASNMEVTGYGNLIVESAIDAGRPIEILPYILGGARLEPTISGDDRLNDATSPEYGLGADVKMQISKALRLTGSVNPDFGQIEADPSEVNLTDQETFFSERRPLFIEDADLYQLKIGTDNENFFYSRRIGAPPTFSQGQTAAFVREPDVTTIYGAAKLSGEIGGGVNVGLLSAVGATERSRGQLDTGEVTEAVIEPMTSYNVAQLSKSWRQGASELRIIGTGVKRFDVEAALGPMREEAFAGAVQYLHQFADNRWALYGTLGGSRIAGSPEAIALAQTASQRYFQRPDADHVELDPTRTDLSGYLFNTGLKKISGNYNAELAVDGRSPGFEVNDVGFLTNADQLRPWLRLGYGDTSVGGKLLREAAVSATFDTVTNFAPDVLRSSGTLASDFVFKNLWKAGATVQYARAWLDTGRLRGGPAVRGEDAILGRVTVASNIAKDFQISVLGQATSRPQGDSLRLQGGLGLLWNVRSNVDLSINPTVIRNVDDTQFVGRAMDTAGDTRYLLGRVRQTTLVSTVRLNYTITPRMSLQLYAQPFLSSGTYAQYKESADVRADDYEARYADLSTAQVTDAMGRLEIDGNGDGVADYAVRKPDFQVSTLISNLVFRWEFRPGSNLYVIWSQARNGFVPDGAFATDDLALPFTNPSVHVVMAKLTYWWNL